MKFKVLFRRKYSMKNKVIALITSLLGLVAAVGPRTVFAVCSSHEMKMKCYYTAGWELAVGIIAVIAGIALFLAKDIKLKIALSSVQAVLGAFIILIPTAIVGVCSSPMMHCVSVTKPALIVTGTLEIVAGLLSLYFYVAEISVKDKLKVA